MMNFDERKAEVFRRSQVIIEKRRKKNRIIALCLPFVLCAFIFSVTVLPAMLPAKKEAPKEPDGITSNLLIDEEEDLEMYASNAEDASGQTQQISCLNISVSRYDFSINRAEALIEDNEQIEKITKMLDEYSYAFQSDSVTSDVNQTTSTQQSVEQSASSGGTRGENQKGETSSRSSQKKGASSTYYITLTFSDGTEKNYTLRREILISDNEVIELTKQQASLLRAEFGIG